MVGYLHPWEQQDPCQSEGAAARPLLPSEGMPPSTSRLPPESALLLIDVVNPFDFPGAERLLRRAAPAAAHIAALKQRAVRAGLPAIYVNDNYGDWHAAFAELVERCTARGAPGRRVVEALLPQPADFQVLKPLHSGFHSTSLPVLLERLAVRCVVLTGMAAHICVLFTAIDAHMRGFEIVVPSDCVASESARQERYALEQMAEVLGAYVGPSRRLRFSRSTPVSRQRQLQSG
jgi:nicotinamidase-related amidase